MFRFLICISLLLVQVFCRPTEDTFAFHTGTFVTRPTGGYMTGGAHTGQRGTDSYHTRSWNPMTTQQPFRFHTNAQTGGEMTTEQLFKVTGNDQTRQMWNRFTNQ